MTRLIDADALPKVVLINGNSDEVVEAVNTFSKMLREAPTIEAEPVKHGKWISHGSYFTCSVCGEEQYGIDSGRYYCQNCGAKMDLDEVEE